MAITKKQFFDFLFVFLIIALILFMLFLVVWLKSEAKDCVADPINYYQSKMENVQCSCYNKIDMFRNDIMENNNNNL